jgi:hypothetical protein
MGFNGTQKTIGGTVCPRFECARQETCLLMPHMRQGIEELS